MGAHQESVATDQKPGATGATWVHGSLQVIKWIRGLGSWEPVRTLKLRKLPGAMRAPCGPSVATEPPEAAGASRHPGGPGA